MALEHGFDVLSCDLRGVALDTKKAPQVVTTPSQQTTFQLQLVESSSDLQESIGISAQGSMKMGVYSVDAKASFAASRAVNSSSVFLMASVVVQDKTTQYDPDALRNMELDSHLVAVYGTNPYDFRRRFGNCFISGEEYGGELYCVLEIITHSQEDKKSLSVEASGSGGEWSASGQFTGAINSVTKGRNVKVWVYKNGGSPLNISPDTLKVDDFIKMAGGFAAEVKASPAPYRAILTPYDELATVEQSGDSFDLAAAEDAMDRLGNLYMKYRDALSSLDYLGDHQSEFVFPKVDASKLSQASTAVANAQASVLAAIRALAKSPDQAEQYRTMKFPSVDDLTKGLPQRISHLPRSARDLKAQYPALTTDGEYDIYLDGTIQSRVTLYCKDMTTGNPCEYITLAQAGNGRNRSYWPASPTPGQRWRHGKDVSTSYSKIRFNPLSRTIDVSDTTFATSTGGPLTDTSADGRTGWTVSHVPYATASASNHVLDADRQTRTPYGTANVDLRGTAFRIDDGVTWTASGHDCKVPRNPQVPDPQRNLQVIDVQVGGAPGQVAPSPELRLTLVQPPH